MLFKELLESLKFSVTSYEQTVHNFDKDFSELSHILSSVQTELYYSLEYEYDMMIRWEKSEGSAQYALQFCYREDGLYKGNPYNKCPHDIKRIFHAHINEIIVGLKIELELATSDLKEHNTRGTDE